MKNMRKFIKQNIKGFIVGLIVTGIGIVTASTIMPSNSVTYNNNSQNVTNVKEALDILLEKADNEAPTVSVSVSGKTATFTLKDDLGVIGYQVTTSAAEPTSWIDITSTTSIVKTWTASSAGTYYVHVKDKFGKTSKTSFVVEDGAFCSASSVTMYGFSQGGNTSVGTYPGNNTATVLSGIDMAKYKSVTFNFSASGCQNWLGNTAYIAVTCDGQTTNILSFGRTSSDANTQAQRTTTASGSRTIAFTSTSGLGTCTVKTTGSGNVCGAGASFSNAVLNCR